VDSSHDEPEPSGRKTRPSSSHTVRARKKIKRAPQNIRHNSTSDSGQWLSENDLNSTLIPHTGYMNPKGSNGNLTTDNVDIESDTLEVTHDTNKNIEEIFPASGVIIKDLFDLYNSNKPIKERESALLNYVNLLFNKSE